jgi:hypothetical protein
MMISAILTGDSPAAADHGDDSPPLKMSIENMSLMLKKLDSKIVSTFEICLLHFKLNSKDWLLFV